MNYELKQTNGGETVWLLYYDAPYSKEPKFGGVFSSRENVIKASKDRENPFITAHIIDREEF